MRDVENSTRTNVSTGQGPEKGDPVARGLGYAIGILVVLVLVGALFVLIGGLVAPSGPRTATEAQMLVAADAVKQYPDSGQARYDLIVSLSRSGLDRQAKDAAKLAKKQLKGLQQVYAYLGQATVLFDAQKYREAVKEADQGLKVNNQAIEVEKTRLAKSKIQMNFDEIQTQGPSQLILLKAQALARLQDWKGSLAMLTEALKIEPRSADILVIRAVTYRQLGDLDKARADYKLALSFIPDYQPAIDGLKQIGDK